MTDLHLATRRDYKKISRASGGKKSTKFTAKTSKPLSNRKFRREKKNRKQENAEENSHRDHVLDIKSCQIRWAKQEPTETCRIRQK